MNKSSRRVMYNSILVSYLFICKHEKKLLLISETMPMKMRLVTITVNYCVFAITTGLNALTFTKNFCK